MNKLSEIWNNKTILVAEDEDMNFLLIKEIFRKYKVNLLRAETGIEALEIFKQNSDIDLVLMDIKMPEMNGYDATRAIKKIRNVPVIAQTAYAMSGEEAASYAAGCDDYITKPIRVQTLIELAQKYLNVDS